MKIVRFALMTGAALAPAIPFWASADPALDAPRLFLAQVLAPAGRITLTPGFSPDGRTMYFAQTECTPIWKCPQRLKRMVRQDDGWSALVEPLYRDAYRALGQAEFRVIEDSYHFIMFDQPEHFRDALRAALSSHKG